MDSSQAITNPFGITVFGSAMSRLTPDTAIISASVSKLENKPGDAFSKARKGAQSVQDYLRTARVADFGAARVELQRHEKHVDGERKFYGYWATIAFRVRLLELDRVDEIAEALVTSGIDTIQGISFESSKLHDARMSTRCLAVEAAFAKATNYCSAAGVTLGPVLHIEDVDPSGLRRGEGYRHAQESNFDKDEGGLDISLIEVGAAVMIAYKILQKES